MIKYLTQLILLAGCIRNTTAEKNNYSDLSTVNLKSVTEKYIESQYIQLRKDLSSADSVILLSHYSPNMPIKNPETGKYYKQSIPFIENGRVNYKLSVQELKQLNTEQIHQLSDILTLPATDDVVKTLCFQPLHAVAIFRKEKMYCFDFCFECHGFGQYGESPPDIIMSSEKYSKLYSLYKKLCFKYEMN